MNSPRAYCPHCNYSLVGLNPIDDRITCPECGQFEIQLVPASRKLNCTHCSQDLAAQPILNDRVFCNTCGGTTHFDDGTPLQRGMLPSNCPTCNYPLAPTTPADTQVRCPECGLVIPATVPDMPWPLRCRKCKLDLTGKPIVTGQIRCPKCDRATKWPTPDLPGDHERKLITKGLGLIVVLLIAVPVIGFVLILILATVVSYF